MKKPLITIGLILCALSSSVNAKAPAKDSAFNGGGEQLLDNITTKPIVGQTKGDFTGGWCMAWL